jgi:hypothetical protein
VGSIFSLPKPAAARRNAAAPSEPPVLSDSRRELDRCIVVLASARRLAEAAALLPERRHAVIDAHDARVTRLAECHAHDRRILGERIEAGDTVRSFTRVAWKA